MRTCSSLRVVLCVLAAVWLGGSAAVAASYEETLATAKAFVAEKSWAKAQEAYAAALAMAPDAEAKRWCELGRVDTGWREAGNNAGNEALLARIAEFENLLERYQKPGTEKDAFWFAAMESWADFRAANGNIAGLPAYVRENVEYQREYRNRFGGAPVAEQVASRFFDLSMPGDGDRLVLCEALAEQRPTPDARQKYLEAVRALVIDPDRQWDHRVLGRLVDQVRMVSRLAESADDRAWFALVAQLLTAPQVDTNAERSRQWGEVLTLAKGTKWATVAAGAELYWRMSSGWAPDREPGAAVDLPARVIECDQMLSRLAPELGLKWPWIEDAGNECPVEPPNSEQTWASLILYRLILWRSECEQVKLQLSMPERFRTDQPVRCFFGATVAERIDFSLGQLTVEQWLAVDEYSRKPKDNAPDGTTIREWSQQFGDGRDLPFRSGESAVAPVLPAGFYILKATAHRGATSVRASSRFLVTGAETALLVSTQGPDVLNCYEAGGVTPLAGKIVRGVLGDPYGKKDLVCFDGTTDASGRAELRYEHDTTSDRTVFAGWVGENPVVLERREASAVSRGAEYRAEVVLDRELYRPGETVRWKLILREHRDGRPMIPARDTKVRVSVRAEGTELIKETELSLSAFGTAAGEVPLPEMLSPGYGEISFKVATAAGEGALYGGYSHFRVEHYRPPAVRATVELASAPDSLRPGKDISVRVVANYLSGGGVAGAPVQCRFISYTSKGIEESLYVEAGLSRRFGTVPEVKLLAGVTDDSGAVVFRYRVPDLSDGALSVRATITPSGAAEITQHESWVVSKGGYLFSADRRQPPSAVSVGTPIEFCGLITDGARRPVGFVGEARVVELSWQEVWRFPDGRIVIGPESAARSNSRSTDEGDDEEMGQPESEADKPKCLHAGYRETVVSEVPIRTEADGRVVVPFTPKRPGIYSLRLSNGGEALAKDGGAWPQVIAWGDSTADLALPYRTSAAYVLDQGGAGLRVLVVLPEGQKRGWLVANTAKRAAVQRVELIGRAGVVTVATGITRDGEYDVAVYPDSEDGLAFDYFTFRSGEPSSELALGIATAADLCRPGASTTVKLRVNASAQDQIPAELWVNVIDEAVVGLTQSEEWRRTAEDFRPVIAGFSHLCREPRKFVAPTVPTDTREGVQASDPRGKIPLRHLVRRMSLADYSELSLWLPPELGWRNMDPSMCCAEAAMGAAGKPRKEIVVRTRFDATAFWAPQVVTDAKGEATVSFNYPDNLTQWRIEAYAVGADGNSFGTATAFTRTSLPFQARLNLPRFLVAGDRAAPSATLVNRTDAALTANAELAVGGAVVATEAERGERTGVAVPAQGEAQVVWPVRAGKPGTAEFTLKAWAEAESDGMKLSLPVLEDGILQETAASGQLARGEKQHELALALPEPLDPARTTVRVQLTGSRAATVLDALPYLVDYPYGCVEQTLSRFLPAVVAKRTLGELGFDAASVETRILGQETPADAARRAKTAGLGRLDEVVAKSLARLSEAQRSDGGFGWWPGAAEGDLWMTAYALWGLNLARGAGVDVPPKMLERASTALTTALGEKKWDWNAAAAADARAWALAAVAGTKLDEREAKRRAEAWTQAYAGRDALTASGRASLALAVATLGTAEERAVLLRNLENGLVRDAATGSGALVHWGSTSGYWRASEGAVEATALTVLALLELEPQHPLAEPAMNWLVLNRRSGNWESTRATALAVLALSRFMQVRGETLGETEVEVLANGTASGRVKLNRATLLAGATVVELPVAKLRAGRNRIALRRVAGDGPAYAVALAKSWAAGDTVKAAGHQAAVARGFVRQKATPTLIGTLRFDPEVLASGGAANTGEEVQAVVTVTVPNDLEYVMVEVPKPAGCEPLNPLSGWDARIRRVVGVGQMADGGALRQAQGAAADRGGAPSLPQDGAGRAIYREERDEKSVFFLDHLAAGTWEIRYGMRAVTAGDFRALPVQVEAMYVPKIRANSDARRLRVEKRE